MAIVKPEVGSHNWADVLNDALDQLDAQSDPDALLATIGAALEPYPTRSETRHLVTVDDLPTTGLVYAHRGGSSRSGRPVANESTLESYRYMLATGQAHILDGDIRLTRDGVPVLCHDNDTKDPGVAGGLSETSALLTKTSYKDLPLIDLSRLVGTGWAPEKFLTLEDFFFEFGGRVVLCVETKDDLLGVQPIADLIHKYGLARSVIINASAPSTGAAITAAGCLAQLWRLGAPVDEAWLDAAAAAGAYSVELPIDAPTALVDYALSLPFERVITGLSSTAGVATPIDTFEVIDRQDPRLSGYSHDAGGYIGRPGGRDVRSADTVAGPIRTGRRGPGWKVIRSAGFDDWLQPGSLFIRKATLGTTVLFGDLSGAATTQQTITAKWVFDTLPTNTTQYAGIKPYSPAEDPANPQADTVEGYKLGLRADGVVFLNSIALGGGSSATVFNNLPGVPCVAGTEYAVTMEIDDSEVGVQKVRVTREDALTTAAAAAGSTRTTLALSAPLAVAVPHASKLMLPDGTTLSVNGSYAIGATSLTVLSAAIPTLAAGDVIRATSGWITEGTRAIWRGHYHSAWSTLTDGTLRLTDLSVEDN